MRVAVGDGALRSPAALAAAAQPVPAVVGRAVHADRAPDARRGLPRTGRGPRGTRRCACRTSCRSGRCGGSWRASACGTTRGGAQCSLASLTSLVFEGERLVGGPLHRAGGRDQPEGDRRMRRLLALLAAACRAARAGRLLRRARTRSPARHGVPVRVAGRADGDHLRRRRPPADRRRCRATDLMDDGNRCRLSDFPGKVVVLNLWGAWCPPCRVEAPQLQKVYEERRARGSRSWASTSATRTAARRRTSCATRA